MSGTRRRWDARPFFTRTSPWLRERCRQEASCFEAQSAVGSRVLSKISVKLLPAVSELLIHQLSKLSKLME
ncbi:hypothetical protein TRAPUB_2075 [Trametes pubescens]|uniref:Uncharacterized protein n=1 Tax=Trametes pubescens TaxID=154538 RepID=A0A1M2VHG6_TRAPU|nr:hypothetical protein TRAPUB_2075 [Trametes pubescens]